MSLSDRLAPPSLGSAFRWIWASNAASNLGDGIVLAASPLLVASLTRSPLLVALSVFLQQVPWLLFGFVGGFFFSIPTLVDYLWPLWDDENRCLHDMVVSTHVVKA